jgi:hypothetical protein
MSIISLVKNIGLYGNTKEGYVIYAGVPKAQAGDDCLSITAMKQV